MNHQSQLSQSSQELAESQHISLREHVTQQLHNLEFVKDTVSMSFKYQWE